MYDEVFCSWREKYGNDHQWLLPVVSVFVLDESMEAYFSKNNNSSGDTTTKSSPVRELIEREWKFRCISQLTNGKRLYEREIFAEQRGDSDPLLSHFVSQYPANTTVPYWGNGVSSAAQQRHQLPRRVKLQIHYFTQYAPIHLMRQTFDWTLVIVAKGEKASQARWLTQVYPSLTAKSIQELNVIVLDLNRRCYACSTKNRRKNSVASSSSSAAPVASDSAVEVSRGGGGDNNNHSNSRRRRQRSSKQRVFKSKASIESSAYLCQVPPGHIFGYLADKQPSIKSSSNDESSTTNSNNKSSTGVVEYHKNRCEHYQGIHHHHDVDANDDHGDMSLTRQQQLSFISSDHLMQLLASGAQKSQYNSRLLHLMKRDSVLQRNQKIRSHEAEESRLATRAIRQGVPNEAIALFLEIAAASEENTKNSTPIDEVYSIVMGTVPNLLKTDWSTNSLVLVPEFCSLFNPVFFMMRFGYYRMNVNEKLVFVGELLSKIILKQSNMHNGLIKLEKCELVKQENGHFNGNVKAHFLVAYYDNFFYIIRSCEVEFPSSEHSMISEQYYGLPTVSHRIISMIEDKKGIRKQKVQDLIKKAWSILFYSTCFCFCFQSSYLLDSLPDD